MIESNREQEQNNHYIQKYNELFLLGYYFDKYLLVDFLLCIDDCLS